MPSPEQILFFVDVGAEMAREQLKPSGMSRINMTKRLLKRFVWLKSSLYKNHEYGIVELGAFANWHTPFTSDTSAILTAIDSLHCHDNEFDSLDSDTILQTMLEAQPENPKDPAAPSLRAIIIYGRSNIPPSPLNPDLLARLKSNPNIYIDAVYLHGLVREHGNIIQTVFDRISEFEMKEDMYMYELTQRSARYGVAMAQLIAHPAQRVKKQDGAFPLAQPPELAL